MLMMLMMLMMGSRWMEIMRILKRGVVPIIFPSIVVLMGIRRGPSQQVNVRVMVVVVVVVVVAFFRGKYITQIRRLSGMRINHSSTWYGTCHISSSSAVVVIVVVGVVVVVVVIVVIIVVVVGAIVGKKLFRIYHGCHCC
jgi:hypothetical protein